MMNLEQVFIPGDGFTVPGVMIRPSHSAGAAVIIHGYGGNKEEQLGLAWRIAATGITACVIDLRGHGENSLALDENVSDDVTAAVNYCSAFGKVAAIGHSLGGRLAFVSQADFAIGISPALARAYSARTREILTNLRSYRVRENHPGVNFEILEQLPEFRPASRQPAAVIYGSRDVPEIINSAAKLKETDVPVTEITQAFHNDIFLLEETFKVIRKRLKVWYGVTG